MENNLRAVGLKLSEEEIAGLKALYPTVPLAVICRMVIRKVVDDVNS